MRLNDPDTSFVRTANERRDVLVLSASVFGIVGAGGIRMSLPESLHDFDYASGAAILLIILVTVSLLDILGTLLRKVVIDGEDHHRSLAYLAFLTELLIGLEVVL